MERLIHAFPRPREQIRDDELGFEILELILEYGLLCTPERLLLYADPETERLEKRRLYENEKHYDVIEQSRACFTLIELDDLSRQLITDPKASMSDGARPRSSHLDVFGHFAISLDVMEARKLGVLPTIYFYDDRAKAKSNGGRASGLSGQLINRLDEIRNLLAILSHIEAIAGRVDSTDAPSRATLESIGITSKYEDLVERRLEALSTNEARQVLRLFDTDRVAAWSLVDFVKMLFSLFQSTDSTFSNEPLAFFRQREWRLIHHMRKGLEWFCIGDRPFFADSSQTKFSGARWEIRRLLERRLGNLDEQKLKNFWILSSVDAAPFRRLVREIVVPSSFAERTQTLLDRFSSEDFHPRIVAIS